MQYVLVKLTSWNLIIDSNTSPYSQGTATFLLTTGWFIFLVEEDLVCEYKVDWKYATAKFRRKIRKEGGRNVGGLIMLLELYI